MLPTVAPQNEQHIPQIHNENTDSVDQAINRQARKGGTAGSDIFNLDIRDVLGIDTGYRGKSPFGHYGDSEDYFVVIADQVAHCHKRKVTYNPGTAALVLENERMASDPGGSFSKHEKFMLWKHCYENNLIPDHQSPPKDGLINYGKRHNHITDSDIEERDGKYGTFRAIADFSKKLEIIEDIGQRHGLDVKPIKDNMLSNDSDTSGSSDTTTADTDTTDSASPSETTQQDTESSASDAESASGDGESSVWEETESETDESDTTDPGSSTDTQTATTTSSDPDQSASEDAADGDDTPVTLDEASGQGKPAEGQLQDTTTNPDGPDSDEIFEDMDGLDEGETEGDNSEKSGEYIRFQTYDEPDLSTPGIDIDRNAVAQFIESCMTVAEKEDRNMRTPVNTVYDAFTTWAEINDIDLDDLSTEWAEKTRKSELKTLVLEVTDVDTGRPKIDGERTRVYYSLELSELGESLLSQAE